LEALGTLLRMAGEALFELRLLDQDRVLLGMHGVAGRAGHIVGGMLATLPIDARAVFVAGQADRVALGHRRDVRAGETNGRQSLVLASGGHMLGTGPVAAFAAVIGE